MLAVASAVLATACSSGGPARSAAPHAQATQQVSGPPDAPGSADRPCGVASRAPSAYQHVIWIVFENHSADEVIGAPEAPYTTSLARRCGSASAFGSESRPSLPNYIAMTSGDTQSLSDDAPPSEHPLDVPNIFAQLGGRWRLGAEGMPSPCSSTDAGRYAVKHNPAAYYTNLGASCAAQDLPLTTPVDISAAFTFLTPDLCHDTHDCPVDCGDSWLQATLPGILDSATYAAGRTAVFVTWDEPADGADGGNVPTLVIAPSVTSGQRRGHPLRPLLAATDDPGDAGALAAARRGRQGGQHAPGVPPVVRVHASMRAHVSPRTCGRT